MTVIIKSTVSGKEVSRMKCRSKAEAQKWAKFINENMASSLRVAEVE